MSDFLFANPVKKPTIDPDQKYMDLFNLSKDEISRIELIGNALATDDASTNRVGIAREEGGNYLVEIVPSCYAVAADLHTTIQHHVDGKTTINPDRNLVKLRLAKKVYAQCLVQWLIDYRVTIHKFTYPLDFFTK